MKNIIFDQRCAECGIYDAIGKYTLFGIQGLTENHYEGHHNKMTPSDM